MAKFGFRRSEIYCCPFFHWDAKECVQCEGCKVRHETREREFVDAYVHEYCADLNGWRRCTVARMLLRRYEAGEA